MDNHLAFAMLKHVCAISKLLYTLCASSAYKCKEALELIDELFRTALEGITHVRPLKLISGSRRAFPLSTGDSAFGDPPTLLSLPICHPYRPYALLCLRCFPTQLATLAR